MKLELNKLYLNGEDQVIHIMKVCSGDYVDQHGSRYDENGLKRIQPSWSRQHLVREAETLNLDFSAPAPAAKKFDTEKPPVAIIPHVAEIAEAAAFAEGRNKYGLWNYLQGGLTAIQLLSAVRRHIGLYLAGEQVASDSGVHHLGHARAGLAMVLDLEARGLLIDDRPPNDNRSTQSSI
jgi:hypothetical protein